MRKHFMMKKTRRLALVLAASALMGCSKNLWTGEQVDVDACAGDHDVDDVTTLAYLFEDSAIAMVTYGGLRFVLITRLLHAAQTFMADPDALEDGFAFVDGRYLVEGAGASMEVWFADGDGVLSVDLFDLDSYLVDADLVDNGDGTVTVTFVDAGPLVSLLGHGDAPESPLLLDQAAAEQLALELGALEVSGTITVDTVFGDSTISYAVDNPALAVTEALISPRMPMELLWASGVRSDLDQDLAVTRWDVDYVPLSASLDGEIRTEVTGGPFDYQADFTYVPLDVFPAVSITCTQ
jgi:hypothetical protein